LLADHAPGVIVVGGSSAGENIAAATVLRARDEGLPLPAGLVLLSPEIDPTASGDSFETLMGIDRIVWYAKAARIALVASAQARAASPEYRQSLADGQDRAAQRAVVFAADKLGERQSVFSESALHEEAGQFALGKVGYAAIVRAVAASDLDGDLMARSFIDKRGVSFLGFTTRSNIEDEKTLLRVEANERGQSEPVISRLAAAATTSYRADAKLSPMVPESRPSTNCSEAGVTNHFIRSMAKDVRQQRHRVSTNGNRHMDKLCDVEGALAMLVF
jgi:alpha/beta hydrolase fold